MAGMAGVALKKIFKEITKAVKRGTEESKKTPFQEVKEVVKSQLIEAKIPSVIEKCRLVEKPNESQLGEFKNIRENQSIGDKKIKGNIGELLAKIEEVNRGAENYRDQIEYSIIEGRRPMVLDSDLRRPVGATATEVCLDTDGKPFLKERIIEKTENVSREIKNFSKVSIELELRKEKIGESHLLNKQLTSMKNLNDSLVRPAYNRLEVSLPRDIALDPEVGPKIISKIKEYGGKVSTHMSLEDQRKLGLWFDS